MASVHWIQFSCNVWRDYQLPWLKVDPVSAHAWQINMIVSRGKFGLLCTTTRGCERTPFTVLYAQIMRGSKGFHILITASCTLWNISSNETQVKWSHLFSHSRSGSLTWWLACWRCTWQHTAVRAWGALTIVGTHPVWSRVGRTWVRWPRVGRALVRWLTVQRAPTRIVSSQIEHSTIVHFTHSSWSGCRRHHTTR